MTTADGLAVMIILGKAGGRSTLVAVEIHNWQSVAAGPREDVAELRGRHLLDAR